MKTESSILIISFLTALSIGSSSCSKSENSLFGGIPTIYEEQMVEFAESVKDLKLDDQGDIEANAENALVVLAGMQASFQKAEEKAKPLAEGMVGKTVPYTVSDSLPYQIVSDIKVEKVLLPAMSLTWHGGKTTRLKIAFDAVFTQKQDRQVNMYFFIMSGDQPVGYDQIWKYGTKNAGDTLHVQTTVDAPDIPSEYLETCDELLFVTPYTFETNKKSIIKQQKEWNEAFEKKLGLNED